LYWFGGSHSNVTVTVGWTLFTDHNLLQLDLETGSEIARTFTK